MSEALNLERINNFKIGLSKRYAFRLSIIIMKTNHENQVIQLKVCALLAE